MRMGSLAVHFRGRKVGWLVLLPLQNPDAGSLLRQVSCTWRLSGRYQGRTFTAGFAVIKRYCPLCRGPLSPGRSPVDTRTKRLPEEVCAAVAGAMAKFLN